MEGMFMINSRILILDDESTLRTALFRMFDRKGYQVLTANKIEEAKLLTQSERPLDLAILDMNLPDGNGIEFMNHLKMQYPDCAVIILTGHATVETAVHATRQGAFQFLTKPFNLDELLILAEQVIAQKKGTAPLNLSDFVSATSTNVSNSSTSLSPASRNPRRDASKKYIFSHIIGESESIKNVLSLIEKVADTDSTVLITGESGTGKELMARAIHHNSGRARGPFIPINCGAIPSELLESELFGHVKGAFTGAIANRIGRFELADGGTIFLDEIGDLEPPLQVKILRALQERSFEPVGSTKTVSVNVRVIAATNINLEDAVERGRFREDLFYRLNVIPIAVPALRERKTDIPLLLKHFIESFNRSKNSSLSGLTEEAMDCMVTYRWPGNIRELENLVERLSILKGKGPVELVDLPLKYKNHKAQTSELEQIHMPLPTEGIDFNSAVDAYENALILKALEKTGWNRNQAANLLRLNRTTLVEKIKKKGLHPPAGTPDLEH